MGGQETLQQVGGVVVVVCLLLALNLCIPALCEDWAQCKSPYLFMIINDDHWYVCGH